MRKIEIIADVRQRLEAQGFSGLYSPDAPCGCVIDDLAPCGECHVEHDDQEAEEWLNGCEAGYKHIDERSSTSEWIVSSSKDHPSPEEFDSVFAQC